MEICLDISEYVIYMSTQIYPHIYPHRFIVIFVIYLCGYIYSCDISEYVIYPHIYPHRYIHIFLEDLGRLCQQHSSKQHSSTTVLFYLDVCKADALPLALYLGAI